MFSHQNEIHWPQFDDDLRSFRAILKYEPVWCIVFSGKLRMSLLLATFGGLAAISGKERPNQGTSSWGREAMRLHTHALIKISVVVIIDSRSSMIKIVIISLKFFCFDQNSPHKCTKVTYIQKTFVVW